MPKGLRGLHGPESLPMEVFQVGAFGFTRCWNALDRIGHRMRQAGRAVFSCGFDQQMNQCGRYQRSCAVVDQGVAGFGGEGLKPIQDGLLPLFAAMDPNYFLWDRMIEGGRKFFFLGVVAVDDADNGHSIAPGESPQRIAERWAPMNWGQNFVFDHAPHAGTAATGEEKGAIDLGRHSDF